MNPNPLSVFRLIVLIVDAMRDYLSTPFVLEPGADEYHMFRCGYPTHQGRNQTGPDGAPQPVRCVDGRSVRATSTEAFGADALLQRWGHVDRSRTRMLLGDVRGEAVRRDLLAAGPAEGLAG